MSVSKYTLPLPVYLPSSGGHTHSRIASEPFHRRVFAFRRYSVDEDGRLVARTRHAGRDCRHSPYEHFSRPSTEPRNNQGVPPASQNTPLRKGMDGATLGRLFQQLAPLTKDPLGFESNAAAICASFDLDPATSTEIVSSFKQQLPTDRTQGLNPSATSGPTVSPIVEPPTDTLLATPDNTTNPAPATTPFKQQRPFCSGSPGVTSWYTTSSAHDISSPPPEITPEIGELYVHHNRVTDVHHVWLYGVDRHWKCVTEQEKVYHPAVDDRVLSMRVNGTPNWITTASFTTIRGRKGKARVAV